MFPADVADAESGEERWEGSVQRGPARAAKPRIAGLNGRADERVIW
jgi:hypothetical protein